MIVPQFWAEARLQRPRGKGHGQVTVRRFGWSNTNQAEAEAMAKARVQEAFDKVVSGVKLTRSEPKVAYNGAHGLPIREEILESHGDVVITRNSYGAHCLNTPDVLFADIDFKNGPSARTIWLHAFVLFAATAGAAIWFKSVGTFVALGFLALIAFYPLASLTHKILVACRGGSERHAHRKIASWSHGHPDWHLRLYRTPAGFRVLVMHRPFDPKDPQVTAFFGALGVDRIYAAMCMNQHCFRARVSPKPWRIGIGSHMRPRPGVWPVKPEHLENRQAWIRDYEKRATDFASCAFVETIGSTTVDPKPEAVRELHDRLSQAQSRRKIA